MTESNLHKFLKDVGRAFLFNQRCFLVATEVPLLRHFSERISSELDKHWIIDVCGIGEKYIPYTPWREKGKYKYNVLRGVEV